MNQVSPITGTRHHNSGYLKRNILREVKVSENASRQERRDHEGVDRASPRLNSDCLSLVPISVTPVDPASPSCI